MDEIDALAEASDPIVPTHSPFNYSVGINYESWEDGREGRSIEADLEQITQHFNLIRTYHAAAVGTADPSTPTIDATQAEVIDYVTDHPGVELAMGTANSALAVLAADGTWQAGLMTSQAYTDLWVEMLIDAFGSKDAVRLHLKVILLGNEIDANGPPPDDPNFQDYHGTWIPLAFENLKASLEAQGLGDIAISTTIANYGEGNTVAVEITSYIENHWPDRWNDGDPFVLYNQYTGDDFRSTDFGPVASYFENLATELSGVDVFVGETGYSTSGGHPADGQADVFRQLFSWLDHQHSAHETTVPLFIFDAFDRPSIEPDVQQGFGIFAETADHQPDGFKPGIATHFPDWIDDPINHAGDGDDIVYGTGGPDWLTAHDGDDIIAGLDGNDTVLGGPGADLLHGNGGNDLARAGAGADTVSGGPGDDRIFGGRGPDDLRGDGGNDIVHGGLGDDVVAGGSGFDWLLGGPGTDSFRIQPGGGFDFIGDYAAGEVIAVEELGPQSDLIVSHFFGIALIFEGTDILAVVFGEGAAGLAVDDLVLA